MYQLKNKFFNLNSRINLNLIILLKFILFCIPTLLFSEISQEKQNNLTFSFFGETGETESAFTIAGRNFPVKVGSVGLKAVYQQQTN